MITDAKSLIGNEDIETDLLIIGSGPAGITIARKFIGSSIRVTVLESGGETYNADTQSLYRGTITGTPSAPLDISRLRYFGGTSNHWAGWCRPFEREDFEQRKGWPESGWPITLDDLSPYYDAATKVCQLGSNVFDNIAYWKSQAGGEQLSALDVNENRLFTSIFQVSPPTRFAQVYRKDLQNAANINLILNATALEVLKSDDSSIHDKVKKITGVRASTLDKRQFRINAKATVIAVGGVETSRLLLLSDKVFPQGAGNENDMVGRYFMDHPWITSAAYVRFQNADTKLPLYFDQTKVAKSKIFGTLSPSPKLKEAHQIGGFRLWLRPSTVSTAGIDSARTIIDKLKEGELADNLGDHISNLFADSGQLADVAYKSIFNEKESPFGSEQDADAPVIGASIDLNFEQHPNPDSRLTLDTTVDALGQRRIKLDWRLDDTDWHTATKALQTVAQELGRSNIGRVRVKLIGDKAEWPSLMSGSFHHMGGARMSSDPKKGVVDADCRVHSVENLYVAGSAVFPTCGFANPTLTIVALSLKLADHLHGALS
ncbi:GMC oxidoreductase [Glaciecola sp. MF2-115]|uniref:GMC oxidoreductase n=1 Tax=Glaciecola sp. MF2-115 TaxID=3384827 RepID=UPI0039A2B790